MPIDPRLNDIDDCLYRVAVRALIVQDGKVLLVQETAKGAWWATPGGGVDHGETVEVSLAREIEEELGIPAQEVSSNFRVVHYSIGRVMNGIPRMNLFFKVSVPAQLLKETSHIARWQWFTKDEFLKVRMHASHDKEGLAHVIFGI